MTVPNGPILFNSSTGSDTGASGLGPTTALSGTGASLNTTSTVTLSADTPDLSGVVAGDLLWVDTSSGRQFSIIASVDNGADTVTCDDAFTVTESGRNWGIGGKRATLNGTNSRKILDNAAAAGDAYGGWIIQFESGFTDTITANIRIRRSGSTTLGPIIVRGEPGAATKPVLTANFNGSMFITGSGDGHQFHDFTALNSNGTKTASMFVNGGSGGKYCVLRGMTIGDGAGNHFWKGLLCNAYGWRLYNCEIRNCASYGIEINTGSLVVYSSYIHDNGSNGIHGTGTTSDGLIVFQSIIAGNTGDGIYMQVLGSTLLMSIIANNIIHNNRGDGIELATASDRLYPSANIYNNIITQNLGYGINPSSGTQELADFYGMQMDFNAFLNNSSGEVNIVNNGPNDITLTVDPFVNAAGGDFNLNNTAGGGANLRNVSIDIKTNTTAYPFREFVSDGFGVGGTLYNIIGGT